MTDAMASDRRVTGPANRGRLPSRPPEGTTILVTSVGAATGSRAAAAALACAGSDPDRAGLLIDLSESRAPRPSLIATAAARELEERLAAHLPEAGIASRGRICHLTLPADPSGVARIAAALPIVRESVAVIHVSPRLLRLVLGDGRTQLSGALLRADLAEDRALAALVAGDLIRWDIRIAILKESLGWSATRVALLGAAPAGSTGLPSRVVDRLLRVVPSGSSRP